MLQADNIRVGDQQRGNPVPMDVLCMDSRSARVVVSGPQVVVVEEHRSRDDPDRDHKSSQSERLRAGHGPPSTEKPPQCSTCAASDTELSKLTSKTPSGGRPLAHTAPYIIGIYAVPRQDPFAYVSGVLASVW